MVACENCAPIMKKCVQCRTQIEQMVPFTVCLGGPGNITTIQHHTDDNNRKDILLMQGISKTGHGVAMNNTVPSTVNIAHGCPSINNTNNSNNNNATTAPLTTTNNTAVIANSSNNAPPANNLNLVDDFHKLQQQLQDIKEQVNIIIFIEILGVLYCYLYN